MAINWKTGLLLSQSGLDVLGLKWWRLMCKKGFNFLLPSIHTWPALSRPEWSPLITYSLGKPVEFTNSGENRPSQKEASLLLGGKTIGTRRQGYWAQVGLCFHKKTACFVSSLVRLYAQSSSRSHGFITPWLGGSVEAFLWAGMPKLMEKPFL